MFFLTVRGHSPEAFSPILVHSKGQEPSKEQEQSAGQGQLAGQGHLKGQVHPSEGLVTASSVFFDGSGALAGSFFNVFGAFEGAAALKSAGTIGRTGDIGS